MIIKNEQSFKKWFQSTPKKFQELSFLYICSFPIEFFRTMEDADIDSDNKVTFGSKLQMLKDMYNDGLFGEPEKIIL